MRVVIAAGGTGGHIYPALAVARSLRALPAAPELTWIGGRRGLEAELVPPSGMPLRRLLLRSLRSTGRDIHVVLDPLRLAGSLPQAVWLFLRRRPDAVFTTGGYVADPRPARARGSCGSRPSSGRATSSPVAASGRRPGWPAAVAVTDGRTCAALQARRCYVTGTPIRDPALGRPRGGPGAPGGPAARPAAARLRGLAGGAPLQAAVTGALPELVERCTVLHVTGDDGYATALAAREALSADRRARYRPVPFLADEMTAALAAADLVVGRAGSSTLAECAAFGLPLVCVPYPHAAGHQRANAEAYAAGGAARLVDDADFDAAALLDASRLLEDPARHVAMSAAARAAARPGAADAVAALVVAAAERRPWPAEGEIVAIAAGAR